MMYTERLISLDNSIQAMIKAGAPPILRVAARPKLFVLGAISDDPDRIRTMVPKELVNNSYVELKGKLPVLGLIIGESPDGSSVNPVTAVVRRPEDEPRFKGAYESWYGIRVGRLAINDLSRQAGVAPIFTAEDIY